LAFAGYECVTLALLALIAAICGELAARLRVPRLIGYTAISVVFAVAAAALARISLAPIEPDSADLVLGISAAIILFEVGQRVSWGWLRRNPALTLTSVIEAGLTFLLVYLVMRLGGMSSLAAALIAAISVATSPAVALAVVRELRAQGQITERTLLLTAMNSIYAVLLATVMLAWYRSMPISTLSSGATSAAGCCRPRTWCSDHSRWQRRRKVAVAALVLVRGERGAQNRRRAGIHASSRCKSLRLVAALSRDDALACTRRSVRHVHRALVQAPATATLPPPLPARVIRTPGTRSAAASGRGRSRRKRRDGHRPVPKQATRSPAVRHRCCSTPSATMCRSVI